MMIACPSSRTTTGTGPGSGALGDPDALLRRAGGPVDLSPEPLVLLGERVASDEFRTPLATRRLSHIVGGTDEMVVFTIAFSWRRAAAPQPLPAEPIRATGRPAHLMSLTAEPTASLITRGSCGHDPPQGLCPAGRSRTRPAVTTAGVYPPGRQLTPSHRRATTGPRPG